MGRLFDKTQLDLGRFSMRTARNTMDDKQWHNLAAIDAQLTRMRKLAKEGKIAEAMSLLKHGIEDSKRIEADLFDMVEVMLGEILAMKLIRYAIRESVRAHGAPLLAGFEVDDFLNSNALYDDTVRDYLARFFHAFTDALYTDDYGLTEWTDEARTRHPDPLGVKAKEARRRNLDDGASDDPDCTCTPCTLKRMWAKGQISTSGLVHKIVKFYMSKPDLKSGIPEQVDRFFLVAIEGAVTQYGKGITVQDIVFGMAQAGFEFDVVNGGQGYMCFYHESLEDPDLNFIGTGDLKPEPMEGTVRRDAQSSDEPGVAPQPEAYNPTSDEAMVKARAEGQQIPRELIEREALMAKKTFGDRLPEDTPKNLDSGE